MWEVEGNSVNVRFKGIFMYMKIRKYKSVRAACMYVCVYMYVVAAYLKMQNG